MSDFFGDDFTAELKSYFLNSLISESEKFIDLVDDKLWMRIRNEAIEQCRAWAIDAKTNEFPYLMAWLESFEKRSSCCQSPSDLIKVLEAIKGYAQELLNEKVDSEELASQFSMAAENKNETVFLHCKWGSQSFAIPLLNVVEITQGLPLYDLPQKKQGLLGVIPFRGDAVPVISLKDYGFMNVSLDNAYYIICEHSGVRFSLQVTETDDLLSLRETDLQSIEKQSVMAVNFVNQFFVKDKKSIMVLDLEKMVA